LQRTSSLSPMAHERKTNTSSHPPLWREDGPKLKAARPQKVSRPEDGRTAWIRSFPGWRSWWRPLWVEMLAIKEGGGYVIELRTRGWRWQFNEHTSIGQVMRIINGHAPLEELLDGYRASGVQRGEDGPSAG
jgi:hypothetical protein